MNFAERRKYPRIPERLPCQIRVGEGDTFVAETKNISCGGVLCKLPHPIPLMTQLEIRFHLPRDSSGFSARSIRCVGVVVRQEEESSGSSGRSYATAIYFSDLKQEDRRSIAEFVLQSMLSHDRRCSERD